MLSYDEITRELEKQTIKVCPSFFRTDSGEIDFVADVHEQYGVDPETTAKVSPYHKKELIGNRIQLTSGPLIMPLSRKGMPKKYRFGNYKHIADLRKHHKFNKYFILEPGESLVTLTNEWVSLESNRAAVIVSGVGNYKKGLAITTTLVDPCWKGLLRLLVTNVSNEPLWAMLQKE